MNGADGRRLRVLVNALHARAGGGITYLRHLLPYLAREPDLELHLLIDAGQLDTFGDLQGIVKIHVIGSHGLSWILGWEQGVLPWLARAMGTDIIFSTANYGPLLFWRQVVVLHNAVQVGRDENRLAGRLYWTAVSLATLLSAAVSRRVIAVSEYAAGMMRRPWLRDKVAVIHHGVAKELTPPAEDGQREDFLLAVSDIYIQKNLLRLIQALGLLKRRGIKVHLKVAGRVIDMAYYQRLQDALADEGVADQVELLGYCDFPSILSLYRTCRAFVFPSTVESFGMPLAEAMACGAPVASSNSAAMPEVAGDAALYFDPYNVDSIADAIARIMSDDALRRRLSAGGIERSRAYRWPEAARLTAELIRAAHSTG